MTSPVTETPAAESAVALRHFEAMLTFETDCWDVHEGLKAAEPDFILVDVRGPESFARGHVAGAINIPHRKMIASRMAEYPRKLSLSIAPGPIATAPTRARWRLARLGLPVKMMIGGVTGWLDEGFELTSG